MTFRDVYLGEQAHIVGRSTHQRSPRGQHPLDPLLRDEPENLLLLCGACHNEIDEPDNLSDLTVERLRRIKSEHETRIEQILSLPPERATTVLRMQGIVGESAVNIGPEVAAASVLSQGRFARFPLSPDRSGLEIDIRRIPDPAAGNRRYYESSRHGIDQFFTRQFLPAVESGELRHVSVFALARWPLLAYLGFRIGDKLPLDIYQRHRSTDDWTWPEADESASFRWNVSGGVHQKDANLVLSVSATVRNEELPESRRDSTTYRVFPEEGMTPNYDIVATPAALKNLERAFREVLADIEGDHKRTLRLHVLGAAPLSGCIALGRSITAGIHPKLVLYDRVNGSYQATMEVN